MDISFILVFNFVLINTLIVLLGYLFTSRKMIWQSWLMLVVSVAAVHFIFLHNSALLRMLAIIATTFTAMKVITAANDYQYRKGKLTCKQWLFFAIGWAGMRAQLFETTGAAPLPNARHLIRFGISRIFVGFALIVLTHIILRLHIWENTSYVLITVILLIAYSLILHFGLLSISAGIWRLRGIHTYLLFKQPVKAISLTEFWGKRWNIAFSEMTSIAIFRPLRNKIGNAAALMAAFGFSGLLHELALSLPVNRGYGLPMLYFIIQGLLVLFEKKLIKHQVNFLQHKIVARSWTMFWVVAPAPLLFNSSFITEIIWPLGGMSI